MVKVLYSTCFIFLLAWLVMEIQDTNLIHTDRPVDRDCVREAEFNFEESQLPAEVALEVLTTEVIMCYQLN